MRYEISKFDICDEDDARAAKLSRLGGPVQGISTEAWPRHQGHPMQHLFTLDLVGLELDLPAARGARLLVVFGMAPFEMDGGVNDGVALRWVSQEELDRNPTSRPPDDYVEMAALEESAFERVGVGLRYEEMDSDPSSYESFIGGEPAWSDAGEPADRPSGAFVLQASSDLVPITRQDATLYLFEGGAYIQREEGDDVPKPWHEAIAASRQLVLSDAPPDEGTVTRWGGAPRGISSDEWPEGKSHVLSFELVHEGEEQDDDVVALALFADLEAEGDDDLGERYEVVRISRAASELSSEPPDGVQVLPHKRLEMRPFPAGTSYFDLRVASYAGPRLAWRTPTRHPHVAAHEAGFQLTDELLPNAPSKGTLYFDAELCMAPMWQGEPGAHQAAGAKASPAAIVEGPPGTLHEEETGTALVVGYKLVVDGTHSMAFEAFEQFAAAIKAANEEHQLDWELIVPGDTATDRRLEVSGTVLLGRRAVAMEACDDPVAVEPDDVLAALTALPAVPASYWEALRAATEGLEIAEQPAVYLVAYGPLCTGELYLGRPLAGEGDDAVYRYARCQDMEQQPSEAGVDGVEVASVELMDVEEVDLGAEARAERAASVPAFDGATYYLLSRYD
jgi:hypothetical protein